MSITSISFYDVTRHITLSSHSVLDQPFVGRIVQDFDFLASFDRELVKETGRVVLQDFGEPPPAIGERLR
jgi:hypothetical protein